MNRKQLKVINNKTNVNQLNDYKSDNDLCLRRDSFSDRICDDLCEVLLSYLSFEDKIRFECISHQFQRCVFVKQYDLEVFESGVKTQNSLFKLLYAIKVKKNSRNNIRDRAIDLIAFKSVLKKFKFINKIVIDSEDIDIGNKEKVLQLIIKYCIHLKSIEFDFKGINEKVFIDFGEKCGHKLENINFFNRFNSFDYNYKLLLKLCPNLRSITNISLIDIIDGNDLLVPKLLSIKKLRTDSNINFFETFVKQLKNSLKCLGIILFVSSELNEETELILLMEMISNLIQLEELHLDFRNIESLYESSVESFQNIGIKCKKINKLYFGFDIIHGFDGDSIVNEIFNSYKFFPQLYRLKSSFWNLMTSKSLKDCKLLTHLSITYFNRYNDFFDEIHLYLPQLTHFHIYIGNKIFDTDFKLIAKLNRLKYLIIRRDNYIYQKPFDSFTEESICEIINNCPEIKSIRFGAKPMITHKTIDALISLAEKKPFCDFVHSFGPKPDESEEDFDYLEFICHKRYKSLPKNLIIIPFDHSLEWDEYFS